jgi:25S rRNA (uracil2634-N3)-methyltransferase
LVKGFLKNAREMLTGIGEIHVTHKTTFPFNQWKIVKLAGEVGLYLVHEENFSRWDYPGYENKRGAGLCDQTFPVGKCSTFKFARSSFHIGDLIRIYGQDSRINGLQMHDCKI